MNFYLSSGRFAACALSLVLSVSTTAQADVWFAPGDARLKADIETLADAGVLDMPVMAWPLYLPDLYRGLSSLPAHASEDVKTAYAHVKHRLSFAAAHAQNSTSQWSSSLFTANQDTRVETFERSLSPAQAGAQISHAMAYKNVAWRIQANSYEYDQGVKFGDEIEWDGSYLTADVGRWAVSISAMPYWWGPGNQSNAVLGHATQPMVSLHAQTRSSAQSKSRWLSWLGHWNVQGFVADLKVDNPTLGAKRLIGLRAASRILPDMEVATSLTQVFYDTPRSISAAEQSSRLAVDLRASMRGMGIPLASYLQYMMQSHLGADAKESALLAGAEWVQAMPSLKGRLKAYVETLETQDYQHISTGDYAYRYEGQDLDQVDGAFEAGLGVGFHWMADANWDVSIWHKYVKEIAVEKTGLAVSFVAGRNLQIKAQLIQNKNEPDPKRDERTIGILVKRVY